MNPPNTITRRARRAGPGLLAWLLALALPALETTFTNVPGPEQAPTLGEHEPFSAVIPLRNPYDRAIKVLRVESSCACSELELADHFLLPYQETELRVTVENHRRSGLQRQLFRVEATDPQLEVLDVFAYWHVVPAIAVDAPPPAGPYDQRPENPRRRDVYAFTSHQRPDELQRLRELIRLWSPPENRPAEGLQIEGIDYRGELWAFTPQVQGDGSILIVAHAAEPEAGFPEGRYEEEVTIRTNHPHKREIHLMFHTAIDADAGKEGTSDPWASMR